MKRGALELHAGHVPVERGRLMTPAEIVAEFLPPDCGITARYVQENCRPRVKLGRAVLFYESDARHWIASHRQESA